MKEDLFSELTIFKHFKCLILDSNSNTDTFPKLHNISSFKKNR